MIDKNKSEQKKSKKGRNKVDDPKVIRVDVKMTEEDRMKIKENAVKVDLPMRTYMRDVSLLGNRIKMIPSKTDLETKAEIRKIGVNFNQLVKRINTEGMSVIQADFLIEVNEIKELLKAIIGRINQ